MNRRTLVEELPVRHKGEPCCQPRGTSMSLVQTETLADRLKALADPARLRLLDLLAQEDGPLCVCDITPLFTQNQPTISHHLRLLRQAGLVDTEKRGIWSYYWATDDGRRVLSTVQSIP